jgi:hypothetical protein
MAEQMATISANKGVKLDLDTLELQISRVRRHLQRRRSGATPTRLGRFGLRWMRLLA